MNKIELYCKLTNECLSNSDSLATFRVDPKKKFYNIQNYFVNSHSLNDLHSRILEPFYCILENDIPWTMELKDKTVLIISPFIKSFQKQLKNKFQMFKDENKKIFLDNQKFVFYESFQTIAGNHIHKDWFETYEIMCQEIKKLDFDIALLGCGGYGLPLCNFIKKDMNKSAIYIGGGLQLLFGVIGTRWESHDTIKKIIRDNNSNFIRPSKEEILSDLKSVENGCYI
jgi:hypothetical protein